MPFGTFLVNDEAIMPVFAPSYTPDIQSFNNVNIVQVRYRTSYTSIRALVPDTLELEDQPVMTVSLVEYRDSTLGDYNEYVHQVEVRHQGVEYAYNIILALDGEAAVLFGRERLGLPKVFGRVEFVRQQGGMISGDARLLDGGQHLVKLTFKPHHESGPQPLPETSVSETKANISLRVIPSAVLGAPASVKELVPTVMHIKGGTVTTGDGDVSFPSLQKFTPLYQAPVLGYEGAIYLHGCSATLLPPKEVFAL